MNRSEVVLCLLCISLFGLDSSYAQQPVADTVYQNGKIYTVNENNLWAEAVAIKGGKFIEVGSDDDVKAVTGGNTKVVDLDGKFVMPGVHDSHLHPSFVYTFPEAGALLFPESLSKEEVQQALREFAKKNPEAKTIRGEKWSASLFPGGKAHKSFVDEVVSDRPVVLIDETGHNLVANTKALELAGITRDTPDPQGGMIDKDATTGEPTGYLSEEGMGLVLKHFPTPDQEAHTRAIKRSLAEIRPYGITSFIDMATNEPTLKTYQALEQEGSDNSLALRGRRNNSQNARRVCEAKRGEPERQTSSPFGALHARASR